MANQNPFSLHLLFLFMLPTTNLCFTTISATPSPPPPPTTTNPVSQTQEQLNDIIHALFGIGGFAIWANLLSTANPTIVPITSTLFIPNNDAISHLPTVTSATINFDPLLIPYHVLPQRLSFSDLCLFKPLSRLPTLLPSKTIIITNNSISNFTIDNSLITHPNIYLTKAIAVHGINSILDYSIYGDTTLSPPPPPPDVAVPEFLPAAQITGALKSDAGACLCTAIPISFTLLSAAFAFKILQNPLSSLVGFFIR